MTPELFPEIGFPGLDCPKTYTQDTAGVIEIYPGPVTRIPCIWYIKDSFIWLRLVSEDTLWEVSVLLLLGTGSGYKSINSEKSSPSPAR